MMDVFMDPNSSPPNMAEMGESSDELKDFVTEYYTLAQSMAADNVSADDKISFLQSMFHGSSKNSKRSMRNGMRAGQ
jgi:hypothetical protein